MAQILDKIVILMACAAIIPTAILEKKYFISIPWSIAAGLQVMAITYILLGGR